MKISVIALIAWMLWSVVSLTACGVKGDPLPPEKPSELGRGRPTYKRATENIKVQKHKTEAEEEDENEERD